jgi:hypothetical protein
MELTNTRFVLKLFALLFSSTNWKTVRRFLMFKKAKKRTD